MAPSPLGLTVVAPVLSAAALIRNTIPSVSAVGAGESAIAMAFAVPVSMA
ncbi:MAG: hypothetical protein H5T98_00985 [Syntrophomonadaceae bacterium]|nr:hypothetical protein [Syntrophomonadaceae bacterium]